MTDFPWNAPPSETHTLSVNEIEDAVTRAAEVEAPPQGGYDPCLFVRMRITHGANVQFISVLFNDSDITGELEFDNGTKLTVKPWGIPTRSEKFMKSSDVMKEIGAYVRKNGLTVR